MAKIKEQDIPQGLMEVMRGVQAFIYKSGLEHKLLKLIQMRVSQMNSCAYCIDMHYKEATHAGEDPIRLVSLSAWRDANCLHQKNGPCWISRKPSPVFHPKPIPNSCTTSC